MSSENKALTGRIRGVVQGVCFRAETRREARRLGLRGWVRNSANGDVEILMAGQAQALAAMQRWLQTGPELARVTAVELHECEDPGEPGFEIRS